MIGLLREIPELIKRTDDTVEGLCRSHCSGGRVGSLGRALMAKRAAKVRENGRRASVFIEAASVKVVINCETRMEVMDKVNCTLYRFTVKLKLRVQLAHQMDNNRPHSKDRH